MTPLLRACFLGCLLLNACIKDPCPEEPPYHPPIDSTVCDAQRVSMLVSDFICDKFLTYDRVFKRYAPDGTIKYLKVTVGAFDQLASYNMQVAYANNGKKLFLLDSTTQDTVFWASLDAQGRATSSQLRHPNDAGWYPEQTYQYNAYNRLVNLASFKFTYDDYGDPISMTDSITGRGMSWGHPIDEVPIKGAYYFTEGYLGITDNVEILSYMGHINTQPRYRVEVISSSYPGNVFGRELQGQTQNPIGYIDGSYSNYCLEGERTGASVTTSWRCPGPGGVLQ